MDVDNSGLPAGTSRPSATYRKANKRRRSSPPQGETLGEGPCPKKRPTLSSQPARHLPLPSVSPWPPDHPGGGTAYSTLGPISVVQYPHPTAHHQPLFPTPSVAWPPVPTTPVTVRRDAYTCTERVTGPTKESTTSLPVNYDLASIGFEEQPRGTRLPVNASSGSQQYPDSGATNSEPHLEDLPDPPAAHRPLQTIRVLASAALRSDPKGKLALEEIVDRICTRFEYFQDSQNRAKLKTSIRHALSLYSEFKCSEDLESRGARKVWRMTDGVLSNKYVRERKRKSRRKTVPDKTGQEEQVQQTNMQGVVKGSTCIGQCEDIEFVGMVRAGEKEKGLAPGRRHVEGVQVGEKDTPAPPAAKPKLKHVLHGAAARSTINQILADKESNDGDTMRSHSASPDETPASVRLQASRWGLSSLSQITMPNALLQTPTTHSSLPFTHSASGAHSTSFPAPSTRAFGAAVQHVSPVTIGFGSFAKSGTLALKGFTSVQAPTTPPSTGTGTESGQPIPDGDGS